VSLRNFLIVFMSSCNILIPFEILMLSFIVSSVFFSFWEFLIGLIVLSRLQVLDYTVIKWQQRYDALLYVVKTSLQRHLSFHSFNSSKKGLYREQNPAKFTWMMIHILKVFWWIIRVDDQ
jgi:hypothetical protein